MLRNTSEILGYSVEAKGEDYVGVADTLYFDDVEWLIRYLVVDCGNWYPGKQVLVPPGQFAGQPDWDAKTFPLDLTMEEIKRSPSLESDEPIWLRKETGWMKYYDNWPIYFQNYGAGVRPPPRGLPALEDDVPEKRLRDAKELLRYRVHATDGYFGEVRDTVLDDETWALRYLVVHTEGGGGASVSEPPAAGGLTFKDVLIAPDWVEDIRWESQSVHVTLDKKSIAASPEYDVLAPIEREYEERLYRHYGSKQ